MIYDEALILSTALIIGSNLVLEYELDGFQAVIEVGQLRVTAIKMDGEYIVHSNKSETIYNIQYSGDNPNTIIMELIKFAALSIES